MQSFHYSNVRSRTTDSEVKDSLRTLYTVVNLVPLPAVKSLVGIILAIVAAASNPVQWEDIKGWINNLKSEATIATFLAAVQAQTIAISFSDHSTIIATAANTFGFMGIMFDVIAALLALLSSTVMQTRVSVIDRIISNIEKVNHDQLAAFLGSLGKESGRNTKFVRAMLRDIAGPLLKRLSVIARQTVETPYETTPTTDTEHIFDPEENAQQVIKCCTDIDKIRVIGDAAGASMFFGVLDFMASIVCLSIASQPKAVWIPTVVACSCVVFLPLVNKMLAHIGLRLPSIFDV